MTMYLRLIADLTKSEGFIEKKNLFCIATVYSILVCKSDYTSNSSFFKLLTLILKSSGCTKDMINCLSSLGICQSYSTIKRLRKWLAEVDEVTVQKQASIGVIHIIFDNLDFHVNTLQHLTLPLLMFEVHPTMGLDTNDELTLHQTLDLFTRELLDLEAESHKEEKKHFLQVIYNVLATDICPKIEGLEWVKTFFELHYNHKYSESASTRTILHVETPKALDENTRDKQVKFLKIFLENLKPKS